MNDKEQEIMDELNPAMAREEDVFEITKRLADLRKENEKQNSSFRDTETQSIS
jgi:hypothetical protein